MAQRCMAKYSNKSRIIKLVRCGRSLVARRSAAHLWRLHSGRVVARVLGDAKPLLLVMDPPYAIELDSEWRGPDGPNTAAIEERVSFSRPILPGGLHELLNFSTELREINVPRPVRCNRVAARSSRIGQPAHYFSL